MKIRTVGNIIISIVFLTALPGALQAPTVLASASTVASSLTANRQPPTANRPFLASLPVAENMTGPRKIVGADGRESLGVKTTAAHVYVVDQESGATLYNVAADDQVPLASITKLMTARIFRSRGIDWNKVVTMNNVVADGGVAYFANGDQVTVRDLWKAMIVGSSNTAAATLAKVSGLSSADFAAAMNANAAGLGMKNSHFVEPTGLDEHNVSTAADISALARAEFQDPEVTAAAALSSFDLVKIVGATKRVATTDKLLGSFLTKAPYKMLGAKTGYITESGYNIVISVTRENAAPITVVVLGAASNDLRFQEAKSVAYWAFENYSWTKGRLTAAIR